MLDYQYFQLDNGLQVYFHPVKSSPIAIVNVLYNVGSRDEDANKTGFAHLFEHLMFRGSVNIPNYDKPLQQVGGENNAFTSPDVTNYYITLPVVNIETALWLESDRMLGLNLNQEVLEAEKRVVIEEFKQRYLNQPYGNIWLKLRPLAYEVHPYQWATIGKDISHIEKANLDDVKDFFQSYYTPNNAILVLMGNLELDEVKRLVDKWFGKIPSGKKYERQLPVEPGQQKARIEETEGDVPLDAIYKVFHMPGRMQEGYFQADLLSDILGRGKSSRLYRQLVKEKSIFNSINAFVLGSADPGLLVIQGHVNQNNSIEQAHDALCEIIQQLVKEGASAPELQKVKNKAEATLIFSGVEVLHQAIHLALNAALGNPDRVNQESALLQAVSEDEINEAARKLLLPQNSSTLLYRKRS